MSEERYGPTPGPWTVRAGSFPDDALESLVVSYEIVMPNGPFISKANAQLIEAAPDLLAALKALVDWQGVEHQSAAGPDGDAEDCPGDDACRCPIVAQVNAAIAKAEGR